MRGDIRDVLTAFDNYSQAKAAGDETQPLEWAADSALKEYVRQVIGDSFRGLR